MNLHDYILSNALADADPSVIADAYIKEVLALDVPDLQVAALEPSVRPHASRLASGIRRVIRSGPAHGASGSQESDGGPAHTHSDSHGDDGGPAHTPDDSHAASGGPALPSWAQKNLDLIRYCRIHADDNYFIPSAGRRRRLADITAPEWESRATWLRQQAEGVRKSSETADGYAALIRAAGADTIGGVLEQVA